MPETRVANNKKTEVTGLAVSERKVSPIKIYSIAYIQSGTKYLNIEYKHGCSRSIAPSQLPK